VEHAVANFDTCWEPVCKYTTGFAWFDEIVRGSFAYMVFFGAAALWIKRDHFQVEWLEVSLRKQGMLRYILRSFIAVVSLFFLAIMTWYGWVLFNKANALTPILRIPERLFYLAIPISGAVMFIHTIASVAIETTQAFFSGEKKE
jgi:TRAP-type C4-dicarboxylate transport system permease small subunit